MVNDHVAGADDHDDNDNDDDNNENDDHDDALAGDLLYVSYR